MPEQVNKPRKSELHHQGIRMIAHAWGMQKITKKKLMGRKFNDTKRTLVNMTPRGAGNYTKLTYKAHKLVVKVAENVMEFRNLCMDVSLDEIFNWGELNSEWEAGPPPSLAAFVSQAHTRI